MIYGFMEDGVSLCDKIDKVKFVIHTAYNNRFQGLREELACWNTEECPECAMMTFSASRYRLFLASG